MIKEIAKKMRHQICGEEYYPVYQTRKGTYMWRCFKCGSLTFFTNLDIYKCPHNIPFKMTKNGYMTMWCPICRIRIFSPIKETLADKMYGKEPPKDAVGKALWETNRMLFMTKP